MEKEKWGIIDKYIRVHIQHLVERERERERGIGKVGEGEGENISE